jgi:outer membrane lipoprotein SlyB
MNPRTALLLAIGATCVGTAAAQLQGPSYASPLGLFVYPGNGQSPQTQHNDEAACYQWSQQATGIQNPTTPGAPVQAEQKASAGEGAARGGLRGAAGGALLAEIGGGHNTNEAAWAGALIGGARGAKESEQRNKAAQQNAQAATNQQFQTQLTTFNKAFSACMEGKHYTVK